MGMNYSVIATVTAIALASLLTLISITYSGNYITISDLYNVNASASVAILDRLDGREPCISVGREFISISKALEHEITYVRDWADSTGMYNEYHGVTLSGVEAYELIRAIMKGSATTIANKPHIDMLYRMRGDDGYISCVIEYDGRYYDLRIDLFGPFYNRISVYAEIPEDQGYVTVRLAYKEFGDSRFRIVALDGNEHELFAPFNNIIIFINELDSKVRVSVDPEDELIEGYYYTHEYMVPPKGANLLLFPGWIASKYSYTVEPYNIHGRVSIRSYSPCMSVEEVKHGYALANFHVRLPAYLPEGYGYRCGIHIMNNYIMIYYSKDAIGNQHMGMEEALARGVLVMHAYRLLSHEMDGLDLDWDSSVENSAYDNRIDALTFEIDGMKALAYKEVDVDYDLWEKYYYNVLTLYDHESRVIYTLKSRLLSIDDLVDIARSL